MTSQPTLSRFENRLDKASFSALHDAWIDCHVASLKGRKRVVIHIDTTDDPTHGAKQMSMFNRATNRGFYGQFMYNELFFHDGDTGQIIVPILRPGNSHSNKWYVSKRVVRRIRVSYP